MAWDVDFHSRFVREFEGLPQGVLEGTNRASSATWAESGSRDSSGARTAPRSLRTARVRSGVAGADAEMSRQTSQRRRHLGPKVALQ